MNTTRGVIAAALVFASAAPSVAEPAERRTSAVELGETALSVTYTPVAAKTPGDWSRVLPGNVVWGGAPEGPTTIRFGHDVLFAGNLVPAGEYRLGICPTNGDAIEVLLCDGALLTQGRSVDEAEVLRLAAPADRGRRRRTLSIALQIETEEEDDDEEEEDEPWEEEPRAELLIAWADREAALSIESTGMRRESSTAPPLPGQLEAAWRVVQASLDGLVAEDFDRHIAGFSEDFESEFEDGGSAGAHVQLLGHLYHAGGLEGAELHLSELEWQDEGDEVAFSNLVIYLPSRRLELSYRLRRVEDGWEVFHLGAAD